MEIIGTFCKRIVVIFCLSGGAVKVKRISTLSPETIEREKEFVSSTGIVRARKSSPSNCCERVLPTTPREENDVSSAMKKILKGLEEMGIQLRG